MNFGNLINAKNLLYGEFKSEKDDFTFGKIELENGEILKYFIETRKASMVMVQGVKTAIDIQQMEENQMEKVTNIWDRHTEKFNKNKN